MNHPITIVKLSRQAGQILPHLDWLPKDVIEIINKFPYHSARLFAAGMDYVLNKEPSYTTFVDDDPIHFLSSSSYGYTLNIKEFVGFISVGITSLLLNLGAISERALLDKQDLKKVLVPKSQSVQSALYRYNGLNNRFSDLKGKKGGVSFFDKPSVPSRTNVLVQAIDAGASNLSGLKECCLVASYYERAYNKATPSEYLLYRRIDELNYELPPFPDYVEIKSGDKFLFDKPGVRYEKHWPDVLLRDGKYSIVHHHFLPEFPTVTTPNTSCFDDIRMAESDFNEMAYFILCKKNGKWGAVYSDGLRYIFNLIVPFIYDTPEDVAQIVNEFVDRDNDTKWVTWDDFKGLFPDHG